MKTRTFHTKFWSDEFVVGLDRTTRYIFNFLITNEKVSISGIYEMSDRDIKHFAQVDQGELDKAKDILQKSNKVIFYNNWIRLVNADKYNSYNGEKLEKAKEKELSLVPKELIEYQYHTDTSIHTSIDTSNKHINININKEKKRVEREEKQIEESKYPTPESLAHEDLVAIAQKHDVAIEIVSNNLQKIKVKLKDGDKKLLARKNFYLTLENWVINSKSYALTDGKTLPRFDYKKTPTMATSVNADMEKKLELEAARMHEFNRRKQEVNQSTGLVNKLVPAG